MIRPAVLKDIPDLIRMGEEFHSLTPYRESLSPIDPDRAGKLLEDLIAHENGCVLVLETDRLIGMIGLFVYPHAFTGEMVAGELFWWVTPETRGSGVKLLRRAESWAKEQGAKRFHMVAPNDHVGRFYRRLGFKSMEEHYQKDL